VSEETTEMADTIRGQVTEVLDGDTFDMEVTHVGRDNEVHYHSEERIRIADTDAPALGAAAGRVAKRRLEERLRGQEVRCYVQARDNYGRVVADVEVL